MQGLDGHSVSVRLAAGVRGHSLDLALARGVDPASSAQLAARAAWLTGERRRCQLAESIERLLDAAERGLPLGGIVVGREGLVANGAHLRALADLLRGTRPLYASGLAGLRELLRDGVGPAYTDHHGGELARRLDGIDAGLAGAPSGLCGDVAAVQWSH
jgi:hypothetical protein